MKHLNVPLTLLKFLLIGLFGLASLGAQAGEKEGLYLVSGSGGPGFKSPKEIIMVLEKGILPTFEALAKLQKDKKILAGGLPVGDRAFVFIVKASSNHEVDMMLRQLPAWGVLNWEVTPLESFGGRESQERAILKQLKKM